MVRPRMQIEKIKERICPYLSKEEWRDTYKISSLSGIMIATCFNYLNILYELKMVEKQKMKSSLNHLKVHWKLPVPVCEKEEVKAQSSIVPEPSSNSKCVNGIITG